MKTYELDYLITQHHKVKLYADSEEEAKDLADQLYEEGIIQKENIIIDEEPSGIEYIKLIEDDCDDTLESTSTTTLPNESEIDTLIKDNIEYFWKHDPLVKVQKITDIYTLWNGFLDWTLNQIEDEFGILYDEQIHKYYKDFATAGDYELIDSNLEIYYEDLNEKALEQLLDIVDYYDESWKKEPLAILSIKTYQKKHDDEIVD